MSNCGAGACGICCPGPCNCVEITDITINPGGGEPQANDSTTVGCECWCSGGPIPQDFLSKITQDSRISYHAEGMPLGEIGAIFACAFPGEIFVPAEKVNSPVTVNLKNMNIDELFGRIGLVRRSKSEDYNDI